MTNPDRLATVISVRGMDRAALQADSDFVYVGRRCAGWPGTFWGNPFRVKPGNVLAVDFGAVSPQWWREQATVDQQHSTAEKAVDLYRQWILTQAVLVERLPTLVGKRLGCWCGCWDPEQPAIPCHAVVLAKLANALTAI